MNYAISYHGRPCSMMEFYFLAGCLSFSWHSHAWFLSWQINSAAAAIPLNDLPRHYYAYTIYWWIKIVICCRFVGLHYDKQEEEDWCNWWHSHSALCFLESRPTSARRNAADWLWYSRLQLYCRRPKTTEQSLSSSHLQAPCSAPHCKLLLTVTLTNCFVSTHTDRQTE